MSARAAVAVLLLLPLPGLAQGTDSPVEIGGLLRTGLLLEPEETGGRDGFRVFDARIALEGRIGIIFDYHLQGEFRREADGAGGSELDFRLLDARLTLPFRPEAKISVGQFKAPFGREALLAKGDLRFLQRALASRALAPERQVGVELHGEALEQRLSYRAGVFNGNGTRVENDDDRFLYAARAQFNTIGPVEFYEDLVVQVGANIAYSRDAAAPLGPGLDATGPDDPPPPGDFAAFAGRRLLLGADVHLSYRGWTLNGELLRGDFEPDGAEEEDVTATGGYVEGSYNPWGAIEAVVRYDALDPVAGVGRDFLVLGLNVYPGFHAKFGLQLALALADSPAGAGIAGGQFGALAQLAF